MDLKLHANATPPPRTRAYIQNSPATNAALAHELGIHSRTVARWKGRRDVVDRSTRPHRLNPALTDWEEALVIELRRSLALPLDDIVEAMRRCINPELSRSALHRCLQRHRLSARHPQHKAPAAAFHTEAPAGFIHIDVKYLPPLDRRRSYAYVAIDRATRFVYLEILPDRRAQTAAGFLDRFLDRFPLVVHTVLSDNGSEFTDRFAVDKKAKPHDQPSGDHAFDRICAQRLITHRLIRPFHPQTNSLPSRKRGAWSSALTVALASISTADRNCAPIAAFATMPNATPISIPSSPTTTAPACDASATKHPPNSSLISRDTTRKRGSRASARCPPPSVQARGKLWVPAFAGMTKREVDGC